MKLSEVETTFADWRKASRDRLAALDRHRVARGLLAKNCGQIAGEVFEARQRTEHATDCAMVSVVALVSQLSSGSLKKGDRLSF